MNRQPSPVARVEDDTPPSPKRKKVRAKYAPKACVSCRRSKLKCSGENPCQRCLDNGKRCFYSEDQTAAEALQNLSRPSPVQPPLAALSTNGNVVSRRSILPRHQGIERRASDASLLGGLSMEARMARIEGMMETLIQERGVTVTPRGSMERDEAVSDSIQSDSTLHAPADANNANHSRTGQSLPHESSERTRHSLSAASPSSSAESASTIRAGARILAFPSPVDYQKYVDFFFADISPYVACINEVEFRARSERMLVARVVNASDICFLALTYAIFACADVAADLTPSEANTKPPGWQWFRVAEELVDKRKLSGRGDLSLIQLLVLEASYLTTADRPDAAYNVIGTACRLCFQFGLHQQSSWRNYTPFQIHMRQRIFWTVYVLDRRISLSCGRPYCIRDLDIDVEQPTYLYDRDLHPDRPLPEPDLSMSSNMFLNSMICWGRLAGDVWDGAFAAASAKRSLNGETAMMLHTQLEHWAEVVLPAIPLISKDQPPDIRQLRQHFLINTRLNQLRLLAHRRVILSLKYDEKTARLCGNLAIDIIQRIRVHKPEAKLPSSFRFDIAVSLGGALLTLSALLLRDLQAIGLQDKWQSYADAFREALMTLHDLSIYLPVARRILGDFADIVRVVSTVLQLQLQQQEGQVFPQHLVPADVTELFPYHTLDFAQHPSAGTPELDAGVALVNGVDTAAQNTDPWDFEFAAKEVRYGVPWI